MLRRASSCWSSFGQKLLTRRKALAFLIAQNFSQVPGKISGKLRSSWRNIPSYKGEPVKGSSDIQVLCMISAGQSTDREEFLARYQRLAFFRYMSSLITTRSATDADHFHSQQIPSGIGVCWPQTTIGTPGPFCWPTLEWLVHEIDLGIGTPV